MDILVNSNITQSVSNYYVNNNDYKGSKLYFNDNASIVNYCIIKKNTTDNQWYVITNGNLKGYPQYSTYLYQFDFDKYISFDSNKIINENEYYEIDFRFQGNCSSKMYFLSSPTDDIVQDNIDSNYFTLLDDGRVRVNDITDVESYVSDLTIKTNFWNREDGTIYNYPIQNTVEKNSYFPITIYFDYDAWVVLKDVNGDIIKQKSVGNGLSFDFASEFIWIPENCESIDIYEYNSNGYDECLNGVQPNLLSDGQVPSFNKNQEVGTLTKTYMDDEFEPYNRFQPSGIPFSGFGCGFDYIDPKALYVVSADIRVQSDGDTAYVITYIHSDSADSGYYNTPVTPYVWSRIKTKPFNTPLSNTPGGTFGYFIISNNTYANYEKWVDVKNVKIEKVKFDKYRNYIPKEISSNAYGFANDQFYLQAGKTYTLRVIGDNSNATNGRSLLVEMIPDPNTTATYIRVITSEYTGTFVKYVTFTAPLTTIYVINAYYFPNIPGDTTGSVYLDSYYLFEGTVDPGEDISPTDYIPSANEMELQTNVKGFTKSVYCPGHISNDYFYLDNNGVMDKLSCKANAFDLESVEKEYVKLGNKNYNNKTTVKKQIIQNTGYQLDEKQIYSLMKSPLIYKIKPKDYLVNVNYVSNTSTTYIINSLGYIQLPLKYKLIPDKTYYVQCEVVQDDTANNSGFGLNIPGTQTFVGLVLNSSFICTTEMSQVTHFSFGREFPYSPLVVKNVMITEGDSPKVYEPEVLPYFDITNYSIENTSFDGYQHKQLSERNFELTLTDIESTVKRNNIKTTFFD